MENRKELSGRISEYQRLLKSYLELTSIGADKAPNITELTRYSDQARSDELLLRDKKTLDVCKELEQLGYGPQASVESAKFVGELERRAAVFADRDALEFLVKVNDSYPEEFARRLDTSEAKKRVFVLDYLKAEGARERNLKLAEALHNGVVTPDNSVTKALQQAMYLYWDVSQATPHLHHHLDIQRVTAPKDEAGWDCFFKAIDLASAGCLKGFSAKQAEALTNRFSEVNPEAAYRRAIRLRERTGGILDVKITEKGRWDKIDPDNTLTNPRTSISQDLKESEEMLGFASKHNQAKGSYKIQQIFAKIIRKRFEKKAISYWFEEPQHLVEIIELAGRKHQDILCALTLHFAFCSDPEFRLNFPTQNRDQAFKYFYEKLEAQHANEHETICRIKSGEIDIDNIHSLLQSKETFRNNRSVRNLSEDTSNFSKEWIDQSYNGVTIDAHGCEVSGFDISDMDIGELECLAILETSGLPLLAYLKLPQLQRRISFVQVIATELLTKRKLIRDQKKLYKYIAECTGDVGPVANSTSKESFPRPSVLKPNLHGWKGWNSLPEIELWSCDWGAASSFETMPHIFNFDFVDMLAVVFRETDSIVSFSLEDAADPMSEKSGWHKYFRRKVFTPDWLWETQFGKSLYFADYLLGLDRLGSMLPTTTVHRRAPEHGRYYLHNIAQLAHYYWEFPYPWSLASLVGGHRYADKARLMIKLEHSDEAAPDFNVSDKLTWRWSWRPRKKKCILRPSDFPAFIEGGYIIQEEGQREVRNAEEGNMRATAWRKALLLSENYDAMSSAFPVFERVRLLLNLYSSLMHVRLNGPVDLVNHLKKVTHSHRQALIKRHKRTVQNIDHTDLVFDSRPWL